MGTISTNGSARREFPADITEIRFEVIKTAADQQTAMREGKAELERLLAVLERLGCPPEKLTMEQERVNEHNTYNQQEIQFRFSKTVSLRIETDAAAFSAITSAIEAEGISVQYSESFLLSDRTARENKVMTDALEDSRQKAVIIAQSLGSEIKGVESVTVSDAGGGVELLRGVPMMASADGSLAARLSPDMIVIEKQVTAVWEF